MSAEAQFTSEKLVQVHKAQDRIQGELIVSFLRDSGVEAVVQPPPRAENSGQAGFCDPDTSCGVSVLEHEQTRARGLVEEYLASVADDRELEQEAAHKPPLTKEKIGELREAVREERRTFRFLGWMAIAFLGAVALWIQIPVPAFRVSLVVALLAVVALVGSAHREN